MLKKNTITFVCIGILFGGILLNPLYSDQLKSRCGTNSNTIRARCITLKKEPPPKETEKKKPKFDQNALAECKVVGYPSDNTCPATLVQCPSIDPDRTFTVSDDFIPDTIVVEYADKDGNAIKKSAEDSAISKYPTIQTVSEKALRPVSIIDAYWSFEAPLEDFNNDEERDEVKKYRLKNAEINKEKFEHVGITDLTTVRPFFSGIESKAGDIMKNAGVCDNGIFRPLGKTFQDCRQATFNHGNIVAKMHFIKDDTLKKAKGACIGVAVCQATVYLEDGGVRITAGETVNVTCPALEEDKCRSFTNCANDETEFGVKTVKYTDEQSDKLQKRLDDYGNVID